MFFVELPEILTATLHEERMRNTSSSTTGTGSRSSSQRRQKSRSRSRSKSSERILISENNLEQEQVSGMTDSALMISCFCCDNNIVNILSQVATLESIRNRRGYLLGKLPTSALRKLNQVTKIKTKSFHLPFCHVSKRQHSNF